MTSSVRGKASQRPDSVGGRMHLPHSLAGTWQQIGCANLGQKVPPCDVGFGKTQWKNVTNASDLWIVREVRDLRARVGNGKPTPHTLNTEKATHLLCDRPAVVHTRYFVL